MIRKTKKAARSVQKALTPEEQTLVANIKSLLAELEGMQVGDETLDQEVEMEDEKPPFMPQEDEEGGEDEDEYEVDKAIENASPDESTANDDAEDRLEDVPEVDEGNVNEVAKAIARAMLGQKKVKKSAGGSVNAQIVQALGEVSRVMKSMQNRVQSQEQVLSEILEGLGVTQVSKPTSVRKSQNRPVQSMDGEFVNEVAKALIEAAGKKSEPTGYSVNTAPSSEVHKSVGSVLEALGSAGPWTQQ
jgi:hypothetical protein